MTVAENIFLTHPYRKGLLIDDKKIRAQSLEILALIGMESEIDLNKRVEDLTQGQKQIVEIAKALSYNARILILDEPTASLSANEVERLLDVIRTLKKQGISIIFITHSLQDVFRICDRVTVLRDGKVVLVEEMANLDLPTLVQQMTGREIDVQKWERNQAEGGDLRQGTPLLELRNVSTHAIRNVSLKLFPGEVVGIAGLRGSGRTELLRAIYGLDKVQAGEIRIAGESVTIASPTQAIKNGILMVPENRREQGLILDFPLLENVILPILSRLRARLFIDESKSRRIAEDYIRVLNIKTRGPQQVVRYLSGGNQQKVVIAKCFASNARILLLDDPTFGVDLHAKMEIMKTMRDFASRANGVLFVSSQLEELVDICDAIYIMRQGTVANLVTGPVTKDDLLYMIQ